MRQMHNTMFFEKNYAKDKTSKDDVAFLKMQTTYAKELVAAPINVKVENMGDSINSEYPDFSPVLSADETNDDLHHKKKYFYRWRKRIRWTVL